MADTFERITNLLALLLETRQPLSLAEISDRLIGQYPAAEVSRRTAFERDKALLRAEGIPIEQTVLGGDRAGQTVYSIDRQRYELGDLGLDEAERQALHFAVAAVRTGTEWGTEAIWKLGADDGGRRPVELEASLPAIAALPVLFQAASERSVVRFRYRGSDDERALRPYSLLSRNGVWYVVGFDERRGEKRTFRADRIEGEVRAGPPGAFERPVDFDPRTAFPADPKTMVVGDPGPQTALVAIDAVRASQAARELGATAVVSHSDDGSIVVEVPCSNLQSFRHWVLGWLEYAEVLEPAEVRADLVAWLTDLASGSAT